MFCQNEAFQVTKNPYDMRIAQLIRALRSGSIPLVGVLQWITREE